MNPTQIKHYNESIRYCEKLLSMLEIEKETAAECLGGEPRKAYEKATDEAIAKVRKIRDTLRDLQTMQQSV
jgi:hypothetical protein